MIFENTIYNVDCLEGLRNLPDKSIDLIVTDPPYINNTVGGGKPLNIIQTLIFNSSSEGDIVLDPFIGSGTTAVAAMKEKRKYLGFEIEPKYFNIAKKKIENEQRQLNLF